MKLVCHIGTPKTASTFLQNTCAGNPDWLRDNGLLYPDLLTPRPNHITLFYANSDGLHAFARDYGLTSRDDVSRLRKKLSDTIARQIEKASGDIHTMVMSSENLTGNLVSPAGVARLKEFLAPHFEDIRILMYVRRQDDASLSMYGEFMRRGFSNDTFEEFVEKALGVPSVTPYLYYRRVLSMWADAFGLDAITVRKFDRGSMVGGDILADFMAQVLDGDTPPDVSGIVRSPNDNAGFSAPVLEFLRQMHPTLDSSRGDRSNPLRQRLASRINGLPTEPRPKMSQKQSRQIMKHFRPANVWVKKTFFPDQDGPLFGDRPKQEGRGNLGEITLEQFAEYSGELMR